MSTKAKKKSKKKEQKFSFILLIGLLFLIGYFTISFDNVRININQREKQVAELKAELERQYAENARLQGFPDHYRLFGKKKG